MATEKIKSAKLKLELENGTKENGETKIISKTLARLNTNAEVEAIRTVAIQISSMLETPLHKTYKITETEIVE